MTRHVTATVAEGNHQVAAGSLDSLDLAAAVQGSLDLVAAVQDSLDLVAVQVAVVAGNRTVHKDYRRPAWAGKHLDTSLDNRQRSHRASGTVVLEQVGKNYIDLLGKQLLHRETSIHTHD